MRKLLTICFAVVLILTFASLRAHAATDVTGTWTASIAAPDGNGSFDLTFTFKQDGTTLTGTVAAQQGEPLNISNGKVDGDKISFNVVFNSTTISHDGTINGDEIKLSTKSSDGNFPASTLTLKRVKPAATPAAPPKAVA